jgi:hypothetical protein
MRTSFLASALLASLTASSLVACGGSDDGPRTFADADVDTRTAAVVAGSGDLGFLASDVATLIGFAAYTSGAACPKATLSGTDLTVTGNCSVEDGPALDGSFVIHGFPASAPDLETLEESITGFEFRDFGFSGDGDQLAFDGSFREEPRTDDVTRTYAIDLTMSVDADGESHSVGTSGRIRCNADGMCSPVGAYDVEVDAIGPAAITGTWRPGADRAGSLTLTAEDSFSVDFDRPDTAGCYPTTIEGVASEPLCLEELDEGGGLEDSLRSLAARAVR